MIQLSIDRCIDNSENSNNCANSEDIDDYIKTIYISFMNFWKTIDLYNFNQSSDPT